MSTSDSRSSHGRTPNDICMLLVELCRALRSCEFYTADCAERRAGLMRAYRAWRAELDREGDIDLDIDAQGFRFHEERGASVGRGRVDDLARKLRERGVARIQFDPKMQQDDFEALIEWLSQETGDGSRMQAARRLRCRIREGLEISEIGEGDAEPTSETEAKEEDEAQVDSELLAQLRELDRCQEDRLYADQTERVVEVTQGLLETERAGDAFRALLVLATHAQQKGSKAQREFAGRALRRLATGALREDLLERATASDQASSLRASQVLMALGEHAAGPLLDALESEKSADRRAQLHGIAIVLAGAMSTELVRALQSGSVKRMSIAAQLAGELRDARTSPLLAELLSHSDAGLAEDAARALAHIGSKEAVEALTQLLRDSREPIAICGARCLGVIPTTEAEEALISLLGDGSRKVSNVVVREAMRSLGRRGSTAAIPAFSKLLKRGQFFRRRELRELKLAAVAALAMIHDQQADAALLEIIAGGEAAVAEAAQRARSARENASS